MASKNLSRLPHALPAAASIRCLVWGVLLCIGVAMPAAASGPYANLYVFGDSLSDTGNTDFWTTEGPLAFLAPDTPGDAYFDGRFSNGPVFTEWLADGLGLGPLTPDTLGGDNFAYGGAYTSGSPLGQNFFVDDLDDQIDDFLATRTARPDDLFTVLIGANDFLLGGRTDVTTPAGVARW
ncbi:MAG: SGNH/GDSL hydrolase family protein, partial [Planctomycetota bacterium]